MPSTSPPSIRCALARQHLPDAGDAKECAHVRLGCLLQPPDRECSSRLETLSSLEWQRMAMQGKTPEPTSDKVRVVRVPGGRGYTRQFSGFATGVQCTGIAAEQSDSHPCMSAVRMTPAYACSKFRLEHVWSRENILCSSCTFCAGSPCGNCREHCKCAVEGKALEEALRLHDALLVDDVSPGKSKRQPFPALQAVSTNAMHGIVWCHVPHNGSWLSLNVHPHTI